MATERLDMSRAQAAAAVTLNKHWRMFLIEGIVLLVLGITAVILPPIATLTVEILIGWLLLASGIIGLISTFRMHGAPGFGWSLASALIAVAAGIILVTWPLSGTVSLTLVLAIFLLFEGIFSIILSLNHRRGFSTRWSMLLFSGLVDICLAVIIFVGLPGTAAWAIGMLVGINLIFGGCALIAMALHARAPLTQHA
jgi:uncharacterized membrane protein HdeD (DUF308 family)